MIQFVLKKHNQDCGNNLSVSPPLKRLGRFFMKLAHENKPVYKRIVALKEEHMVPGFAVGILSGGECFTAVDGIINVNNPVPVDESTIFQIASLTKTFNALLILLLRNRGLIDLDMPIKRVMPDFQMQDDDVTEHATIRHLLTHTGGWEGDILEYPDKGDDSLKEGMRIIAKLPQLTPLGTVWAYNPAAFYILGRVVEVLLNMPYEQAVRDTVLTPLGMNDSVFTAGDAIIRKAAVGHYCRNGRPEVAMPWEMPRILRPSGGLVCSLSDMMKYLEFLLSSGGVFENSDAIKREMFEQQCEASGPADAVGLAWMIRYIDGVKVLRHGGASMGQYSEILFVPDRGFGFVILSNGDDERGFVSELGGLLLAEYLGLRYGRVFPPPILPDAAVLEKYKGLYRGFANDIDVRPEDGGLTIRYHYKKVFQNQTEIPDTPPPMSAVFYADNRAYIVENRVMCDFFADHTGEIAFLRHGNKVHVKVR